MSGKELELREKKELQSKGEATFSCKVYQPDVDILETEKEFVLTVELPGIDMKGLDISFSDGLLTIKGEKKIDSVDSASCHCSERYSGSFERSFHLTRDIDRDKIDATCKDGILRLVLPKSEESVPKKIEVH